MQFYMYDTVGLTIFFSLMIQGQITDIISLSMNL